MRYYSGEALFMRLEFIEGLDWCYPATIGYFIFVYLLFLNTIKISHLLCCVIYIDYIFAYESSEIKY